MIEYYCNICGDFVDKEDHWKTCTGLKKNHREESMYEFPTMPKGYNINIQRLRGGYYVEVGCERFVFTNPNTVAEFVSRLLLTPGEMEKDFYQDCDKAPRAEPAGMEPATRAKIAR